MRASVSGYTSGASCQRLARQHGAERPYSGAPNSTRYGISSGAAVTASIIACLAALSGCKLLDARVSEQAAACRQLAQRGKSALEGGDSISAEALFAEAIESCPTDPTARRYYAEALWQRGAREQALLQVEEALRLAADDPSIAVQAGEMSLSMGRLDEAVRLANLALDALPQHAAAWALRARVAMRRGSHQEALADLHRALAYSGADRGLLLECAELYRSLGHPQRALATLSLLSETYPTNEEPAQLLYLKGLALAALDRPADALEAYSLAVTRGTPSPELLAAHAASQARLQQMPARENAFAPASAALRHNPEAPPWRLGRNGDPAKQRWE